MTRLLALTLLLLCGTADAQPIRPYFNPDGTGWQLFDKSKPEPTHTITVYIQPHLDQIKLEGGVHPYTAAIYVACLNYGRCCGLGFERVSSPQKAEFKFYAASESAIGGMLVAAGHRPGTTAPAMARFGTKEAWFAPSNRGKPIPVTTAIRFVQHEMMHFFGWQDSAGVNADDPTACLNQNASAPIRYPYHPRHFHTMGIAGFSLRPRYAGGVSEWSWFQAKYGPPFLWRHEPSLVK